MRAASHIGCQQIGCQEASRSGAARRGLGFQPRLLQVAATAGQRVKRGTYRGLKAFSSTVMCSFVPIPLPGPGDPDRSMRAAGKHQPHPVSTTPSPKSGADRRYDNRGNRFPVVIGRSPIRSGEPAVGLESQPGWPASADLRAARASSTRAICCSVAERPRMAGGPSSQPFTIVRCRDRFQEQKRALRALRIMASLRGCRHIKKSLVAFLSEFNAIKRMIEEKRIVTSRQ
jgi:hypothetical protein